MDRLKASGRGKELSKVQKIAQAKVKSMLEAERKRREGLVDKGDLSTITVASSTDKAEVLLCQKLRDIVHGISAVVEIKEDDNVDLELEEPEEDEEGRVQEVLEGFKKVEEGCGEFRRVSESLGGFRKF